MESPAGIDPGKLTSGTGAARLLLRGDVEGALFDALPSDVEIRYSTVPTRITQDATTAEVALHDTASDAEVTERFDLVVGTDGMRLMRPPGLGTALIKLQGKEMAHKAIDIAAA